MTRPLTLRERKLIGWLAVSFIATLFVPFDTGGNTFFWGPFFDAGHFGLFCSLTFCLYALQSIFPGTKRLPWYTTNPILIAVAISVGAEFIQPFFDRSASVIDIVNGLVGICAGGVAFRVWSTARSWVPVVTTAVAIAGIQLAFLSPIIPAYRAIQLRSAQFPVLGRFEDAAEQILWKVVPADESKGLPVTHPPTRRSIPADPGWSGSHSLEISTTSGEYCGTEFMAGDRSWIGYNELTFKVHNPADAFDLLIRIDDDGKCAIPSDRFSTSVIARHGITEISIPLTEIEHGPAHRLLNLGRIRRVIFFVVKQEPDRQFGIDDVELK